MRGRSLLVLFFLVAGCATALHKLPPDESKTICGFLAQRAQQGDFLGCYLAAQRAAAQAPEYGRPINPAVTVDAVVTWDKYGGISRVDDLTTSLPDEVATPPLNCFRDALGSTRLPPPAKAVKVPVRIRVDGGEPAPSKDVSSRSARCLLGPGTMDL